MKCLRKSSVLETTLTKNTKAESFLKLFVKKYLCAATFENIMHFIVNCYAQAIIDEQ